MDSTMPKMSPLVVSTSDMALKDFQRKQKEFDDISQGVQMQSMQRQQKAKEPKDIRQTLITSYGQ